MITKKAEPVLVGRRVLVVEDEFFIADDVTNALEELGAVVLGPVGSVAEALAVVRVESNIELAVLDIELHGEVVFPVAEALRRLTVPFIFATGHDGEAVPAQFLDVPRLSKPFTRDALAQALSSLLPWTGLR